MAATAAQIEVLVQLEREFESVFGERIPRMMLPRDPDTQIRIARECLDQRSMAPIMRLMPPGAYT